MLSAIVPLATLAPEPSVDSLLLLPGQNYTFGPTPASHGSSKAVSLASDAACPSSSKDPILHTLVVDTSQRCTLKVSVMIDGSQLGEDVDQLVLKLIYQEPGQPTWSVAAEALMTGSGISTLTPRPTSSPTTTSVRQSPLRQHLRADWFAAGNRTWGPHDITIKASSYQLRAMIVDRRNKEKNGSESLKSINCGSPLGEGDGSARHLLDNMERRIAGLDCEGCTQKALKGPKCQRLSQAPSFCSGISSMYVPFHGSDAWAGYLDGLARSALEFNYSTAAALTASGTAEEVPEACAAVMQALTCARYFQGCDPDEQGIPKADFCPCTSFCEQLKAMSCPAADELDCSSKDCDAGKVCFSSKPTCTGYTVTAKGGVLHLGGPTLPSDQAALSLEPSTQAAESTGALQPQGAAPLEEGPESGQNAAKAAAASGLGLSPSWIAAAVKKAAAENAAAERAAAEERDRAAAAAAERTAVAKYAGEQTKAKKAADERAHARLGAVADARAAELAKANMAAEQKAEAEAAELANAKKAAQQKAKAKALKEKAEAAKARIEKEAAETEAKSQAYAIAARQVAASTESARAEPLEGYGEAPFKVSSVVAAARAAANAAAAARGDAVPSVVAAARAAANAAAAARDDATASAGFPMQRALQLQQQPPAPFATTSVKAAAIAAAASSAAAQAAALADATTKVAKAAQLPAPWSQLAPFIPGASTLRTRARGDATVRQQPEAQAPTMRVNVASSIEEVDNGFYL